MSEREAFEKWYQNEVSGCNGEYVGKDDAGTYYEKATREAWRVWQKSAEVRLDNRPVQPILEAKLQAMQARLDNRPVQPIMEWVGLTEAEIARFAILTDDEFEFAREIEAALKEKNHG